MSFATALFDEYGPTMRTAQAAELFGCSPGHIRALCQRGELPAVRVGSRWIIPTINIAEFFEKGITDGS